jgi:Relaxase/Mobilisation nuclease domain
MIINGGSRSNGAFFANHLSNSEHNERVTLCEIRNLAATDIPGVFREMKAIAMGSLCQNYFYHANLNPSEHEVLTPEQWGIAADILEHHLSLDGHARLIVEHRKAGRTHRHIIWLRIDVETMRAVVMANDFAKHQAAAREIEQAFGLQPVASVTGRTRASGPRPSRRPKAWESFRGQKTSIDPHAMKETLTHLFRDCATGKEFVMRLTECGLKLVQGDTAEYCILDHFGHLHSLARRLDNVRAADLRAFLREVSLSS